MSSDLDPDTSRLRTQKRFLILKSFNLEPEIRIPTPQNIVVSADLDPDTFKFDSSDVVDEDCLWKLTHST